MKQQNLRKKLKELRSIAAKERIDINDDILRLEEKLAQSGGKSAPSAWKRVELARNTSRPTTLDYIERICDDFFELHGDRNCGDDKALIGGIGTIFDIPVTVIGHQKGRNMKENLERNGGMAHPEGYRKALRLAKEAEKFGRPVISFIDTTGAFCGVTAEERGIGEAIARNLMEFSTLRTPVICFIIGQGGSGGALGIGVGDQVFMLENSIYSVISPEGCASILLRDPGKAKYAANLMKITAADLYSFGIIDGIIPEPPGGAHEDVDLTASRIKAQIKECLAELMTKRRDLLVRKRIEKFTSIGMFYEPAEQKKQGILSNLFKK
ncbi:MAG: acetyl-CoA carboxylase carboxyltransferase subunit alpha [Spirochaetia bacterium]